MKMISSILLLLILSSCLCAATFVVNVTQSSYQAEENHSITLEWTFTTKTQGTYRKLSIDCCLMSPHKMLFHFNNGVKFLKSQDEQFSGRVQIDKDVLGEGRIRLHVSRLRTEDSGRYLCDVKTEDGSNYTFCRLNVTAADQIQTQRPTWTPEPEELGRIIFIIILITLELTALMFLLFYVLKKCFLSVNVYFSNYKKTRESSVASSLEKL